MGEKSDKTTRSSRYAHINDRDLLERMADNASDAKHESKAAREEIVVLRNEVRLALRPTHRGWYEKASLPALTLIAFVFLIVYSTKVSSATVPEPVSHSTAAK